MRKKLSSIFWGIILIASGAYGLAQALGYTTTQNPAIWGGIFGGICLVSLIFYFFDGVKNWGWLFPMGIFGALALMMVMVARGVESASMAAPIFIGIGLPFVVAFFIDRANNWWALIPAGVMAFLILVVLLVDRVPGEWIGAGFLFVLAITFFLVYWSRRQLWSLIVAYVMFVLGFMPLLALTTRPELSGVIFLTAIGLPFLFLYVQSPQRWWAIIPAGMLLTLAIITAVVLIPRFNGQEFNSHIANFIVFAGWAVTFAVVWLRHHQRWAMIVTIGAIVIAIAGLFVTKLEFVWPVIIIVLGIFLLVRNLLPKKV